MLMCLHCFCSELKNRATGIDIYVPQHEDVQGPLGGSVVYNVIVVTRLFYFKMPGKHKESDVVQFMVSMCQPYITTVHDVLLTLSLLSSKSTFSQPSKEKMHK